MSQSLLQSALGGHGSGSFTSAGGTLSSISVSIPSSTTAGSMFLLVCTHHQTLTSGTGGMASSFNNPTGITGWTTNGVSVYTINGGLGAGSERVACQMFFKTNTSSVSGGTVISVAVGVGSGSATGNEVYEFAFYEFGGMTILAGNNAIDTNAQINNTSGVPSAGNLTTTLTDLVMVTAVGDTGGLSNGTGYSSGFSFANVNATSQTQYMLNVPAGTVSTSYASGSQTNCGCQGIAFKSGPGGGGGFSGTAVNYGYLFG